MTSVKNVKNAPDLDEQKVAGSKESVTANAETFSDATKTTLQRALNQSTSLSSKDLFHLQRTLGNQGLLKLLNKGASATDVVHRKSTKTHGSPQHIQREGEESEDETESETEGETTTVEASSPEAESESETAEGEVTEQEGQEIPISDGEFVEQERGSCDCDECRRMSKTSIQRSPAPLTSRPYQPTLAPAYASTLQRKGGKGAPKTPPTDYKVQIGKVNIDFTNPEDLTPSPFGSESFTCAHQNTKTKVNTDKLAVDFTLKIVCHWGVNGGGNTDVPSATDPVVTTAAHASGKKVYEQIASDLTPVQADNWRPSRNYYWSRELTRRHERYHSEMDKDWSKAAGKNVVLNYLKGKTVSVANTATDLKALMDQAMVEMSNANFNWYSGNGKAYLNRPGEMAAFKDGKAAYRQLASAVRQQGKKLEKAEAKAAKATP